MVSLPSTTKPLHRLWFSGESKGRPEPQAFSGVARGAERLFCGGEAATCGGASSQRSNCGQSLLGDMAAPAQVGRGA
eukprot:4022913-Lingulodinium_polyedra.AAC.1